MSPYQRRKLMESIEAILEEMDLSVTMEGSPQSDQH